MVKTKVIVKKGWDWKIAGKKAIWWIIMAVITGVVTMCQDDPKFVALMPLLLLLQNYLKNR